MNDLSVLVVIFTINIRHTPFPPPKRTEGMRTRTRTFNLLFQTLVGPSLITELIYHIQRYKNKTTTVVMFTVSIHSPESYLLIHIQKLYIYIYIFRARNLHVVNPY